MAEEEADFSVLDAAFGRTRLPLADSLDSKLGNEPWDAYVFHSLKLAGVIVEQPSLRRPERISAAHFSSDRREKHCRNEIGRF